MLQLQQALHQPQRFGIDIAARHEDRALDQRDHIDVVKRRAASRALLFPLHGEANQIFSVLLYAHTENRALRVQLYTVEATRRALLAHAGFHGAAGGIAEFALAADLPGKAASQPSDQIIRFGRGTGGYLDPLDRRQFRREIRIVEKLRDQVLPCQTAAKT